MALFGHTKLMVDQRMDLFLDPGAGKPLTMQLYEQLRDAITAGRLHPGDQLVPSRQLAASSACPGTR